MFRKIGFMLAGSLLPMMAFAFCDSCTSKEKIYIQLEDLVFEPNGIWLKNPVDSMIVGTETIHVDSNGYYMSEEERVWRCAKCGVTNKRSPIWGCMVCRWPFDK